MTKNHPLAPPLDLVREWHVSLDCPDGANAKANYLCTQAAQWAWDQRGAVNEAELQKARDEELDACEKWIKNQWYRPEVARDFRNARRPQPSDKELALRVLVENGVNLDGRMELDSDDIAILTRALKALPND